MFIKIITILFRFPVETTLNVFVVCTYTVLTITTPLAVSVPLPTLDLSHTPFWSNPCGVSASPSAVDSFSDLFVEEEVSWHEQLGKSLQKIRHQLKTAKELLVYKEFDKLYVEVQRGVLDRQYIPNWVPSRGDTEALLAIETFSSNEIARYLPVLLKDLQKFAVAFEQIHRDEHLSYEHSPKEQALAELTGTLRQVLCEVEAALWSLDLSYGPPVDRTIMSAAERDVTDYTHRMVRDNGVVVKYRDYLSGWNRLIRVKELIRNFKKFRIKGKAHRKLRKQRKENSKQNKNC